jgi:hypothetical protein
MDTFLQILQIYISIGTNFGLFAMGVICGAYSKETPPEWWAVIGVFLITILAWPMCIYWMMKGK